MTRPSNNALRLQAESLAGLAPDLLEQLEPPVRSLLSTPEIFGLRRIVLTGCGDSFAAALAARQAFVKLTGLPTEVRPALDLARFDSMDDRAPRAPLLLAVSHSGRVARVIEAALRVRAAGGLTVAVCAQADSALAASCARHLPTNVPAFAAAPGTRSYLASLMALLLLAIRIAEVRGRITMDQANRHRAELAASVQQIPTALDLAQAWQGFPAFEFVGSGPSFGSAYYGHAKILEATGRHASAVNSEEWLHLNYFVRDYRHTATLLLLEGRSPARGRELEVLRHMRDMQRPLAVVGDLTVPLEGVPLISYPATPEPWMASLAQAGLLAALAGDLAELQGEQYGRGSVGPWSASHDGATTRDSDILRPPETPEVPGA